jgi:hypothetical protein
MTRRAPADKQQPKGNPSPHGGQEVTDKINEAAARGYVGHRPDETPHEHYALPGVIAGEPTPETEGSE